MNCLLKAAASLSCAAMFVGASVAADISGVPTTIVATRGGQSVTLTDLDAFAQTIPVEKRAGFFDSPARIEKTIDGLLLAKQFAAEARVAGLDKQSDIQAQIQIATDQVLAKARRQQFEQDVKVPDLSALAQEEFLAHKEKYVQHGEFIVQHILINTANRSDGEAKTVANTIEQKAKADPSQFEALVEQYSDDRSKASNHGKVEDAGNTRLYDPAFAAAAAKLHKADEISPVVKTAFGYHVLKLIKREPDKTPTFAEVKDRILQSLSADYVDKAVQGHSDELRNEPLDVNNALADSLRTRYDVPAPAASSPAKN